MSRVAAYARYSSDKQSDSSIEDQMRRLHVEGERRGLVLDPALTFADRAVSGASTARPAFDDLMARVRRREIDVLLVEDTSRLSRDNADALNLYKTLAFYGVQLVAVSDGIDSSAKGAKLQFGVKALFSDLYLDDLRDKTLRGMQGRALDTRPMSTGGRALGYRSVAIPGPDERTPAGYRMEINPVTAPLVQRIFKEYAHGGSFNGIASALNAEGVPSPRDSTRHERKHGWSPSTIRAILMNERYAGVVVFGERRWVKVPGTNTRRPQKRDASEVIRREHPELRIVDDETWRAVQSKLTATRALFTRAPDGSRKGKALAGAGTARALSGLLRCVCGSTMTLYGNGKRYVCAASRRGRCAVKKSLRADVAQEQILTRVRELLSSTEGVDLIRRRIVERIREREQTRGTEVAERRARLQRTQKRVGNIVSAIADGERSAALTMALADLEAQARDEQREIDALERAASAPVRLPSPDEILKRAVDLDKRLKSSPAAARDELHRLFKHRTITMELGADGVYVARGELLLSEMVRAKTPLPAEPGGAMSGYGSGGRITQPDTDLTHAFAWRMVA